MAKAAGGKAATTGSGGGDQRAARLAAELRANLQRRKQQARARRDGAPDERPEGIAAAGDAQTQRAKPKE